MRALRQGEGEARAGRIGIRHIRARVEAHACRRADAGVAGARPTYGLHHLEHNKNKVEKPGQRPRIH